MTEKMVSGYFDHNSTTPVSQRAIASMQEVVKHFANASSSSRLATQNKALIKQSRQHVADLLGTVSDKVFFTSGGSEANNWAIKGVLFNHVKNPGHIITTSIEHASVLETVNWCAQMFGFEVTYLKPGADGAVRFEDFQAALREDTQLVTMMYTNNETGVIQPIERIAKETSSRGIKFHVDGVQVIGKREINVTELDIDYLSFSAHKFYGPKGIGGLFIKDAESITPLIHGGGQEMAKRSGTENILAIAGMSEAAQEAKGLLLIRDDNAWQCKKHLIHGLMNSHLEVSFNGATDYDKAVSNTLNVIVHGVRGEALAALMEKIHGIVVSIGSACSNNKTKNLSHVLQEMGVSEEDIQSSIRVSFGCDVCHEDIDNFIHSLEHCADKLLMIAGFEKQGA